MIDGSAKRPSHELFAFALPAGPLLALTVPPIVFLPPYYNAYLGFDLGTISAVFLAARVADLFMNPLIGGWQDRTEAAFGRRRTWLLAVTPLLMGLIYLAFIALPPGAPALLLALVVMSFYSSLAAMMIAHLGWAGELRPTYHERTKVLGAVQAAGAAGQVLVLLAPVIVRAAGGSAADGVHAMGWTLIAALPICVGVCLIGVKEAPAARQEKISFAVAIEALRRNESLRRVLLPDFFVGVVQGVSGALFLFYVRYGLGYEREAEALLFVYFVCSLLGVPLWVWLGHRLGKHRALQIGCLWWAATLASIPFAPPGALWLTGAVIALAGISQAAGVMLLRAMMADVADEDEALTGRARGGLFFGLLLTTSKIGLAFGPATYAVLALFGFDAKLGAANTPEAMAALVALFAGAPFVLNVLAALSLQGYPLTAARQAELRALIDARRASAATS